MVCDGMRMEYQLDDDSSTFIYTCFALDIGLFIVHLGNRQVPHYLHSQSSAYNLLFLPIHRDLHISILPAFL